MPACANCGYDNAPGSAYCNRCGRGIGAPPGTNGIPERKTTDPSDRIMVTRDALGSVVVEKVRPKGPFFRQTCLYCGRSVKVPEGTSLCPFCARGLDGTGPASPEDPALTDARLRDPARPFAVLCHALPTGDERRIELRHERSILGRTRGIPRELVFPADIYLSPSHAEFCYTADRVRVIDRGSLNGVFLVLRTPWPLEDGAHVIMGEQVFRFVLFDTATKPAMEAAEGTMRLGSGVERPGAKFVKILADGADGPEYPLSGRRRIFGRQAGHYGFPDDTLMSQRQAMVEETDGRYWLTDLESTNGTLVQIRELDLEPGTLLRIGSQRFRIEYDAGRAGPGGVP